MLPAVWVCTYSDLELALWSVWNDIAKNRLQQAEGSICHLHDMLVPILYWHSACHHVGIAYCLNLERKQITNVSTITRFVSSATKIQSPRWLPFKIYYNHIITASINYFGYDATLSQPVVAIGRDRFSYRYSSHTHCQCDHDMDWSHLWLFIGWNG